MSVGEGAGQAEGREREPDRHAVQQGGGADPDQGDHERRTGGAGPAAEEGEHARARPLRAGTHSRALSKGWHLCSWQAPPLTCYEMCLESIDL